MPTVDWFLSHLGDLGWYQVIIMILMAANAELHRCCSQPSPYGLF